MEILLEKIPNFPDPKIELEQYITPTPIAAKLLWTAYMKKDIKDRVIYDLGCGTGRLAIGAAVLGAKEVFCIDIDPKALNIARNTYQELINVEPMSPINFLVMDLRRYVALRVNRRSCTVVMNPPFGVQSRGADIDFLKVSLMLCDVIYSIHKYSLGLLRIIDTLSSKYRYRYEVIERTYFPIRWFLPKHRKKVYYVDSLILRLRKL